MDITFCLLQHYRERSIGGELKTIPLDIQNDI